MFTCPICSERLSKTEHAFYCPKGHSYDRASEGYVHLMPSNLMHSAAPGDTREMVAARRLFLESGYYKPFRDKAVELAEEYARGGVLLDAGCGEGYYTREIGKNMESYGFDISKVAVKAAAKRDKHTTYAVAGSYNIPFENDSCNMLTSIFSPIVPEEFLRVTASGGFLLIAVPSENHLYGLKKAIYEEPYRNKKIETEYIGFSFISRTEVRDSISLESNELIYALFSMTPYFWKSPKETSDKARNLRFLETEIGFDFLLYTKK